MPGWLEWLEPLAVLPLWAQAAILSGTVALVMFIGPLFFRWIWKLGGENESDD